ncbi:MAG: hypothetical protein JNJ54_31190 [Myxococcaceae bacterium]|nr:hypothetical protein [Myxococcaceae bacterium]
MIAQQHVLLTSLQALARRIAPGSTVSAFPQQRGLLELEWQLPPTGSVSAYRWWANVVRQHAIEIDRWYASAGQLLLNQLAAPEAWMVQSWFSSDWHGHDSGPGASAHLGAAQAALDHGNGLRQAGFEVVMTSDHGARLTGRHLEFDPTAPGVLEGTHTVPLPSLRWCHEGDHLVGYDQQTPLMPTFVEAQPPALNPVSCPPATITSSFVHSQMPTQVVFPRHSDRIGRRLATGGGITGRVSSSVRCRAATTRCR